MKFKVIDSTHSHAIRLAEKENYEECIIVSEEQTNGIGRCGRKWISPTGNLFLSILKKTSSSFINNSEEFGKLSLTIACAVRETIAHYVLNSEKLLLYWPNDVYYDDKKISGILLSKINDFLIISIGINVNSAPCLSSDLSFQYTFPSTRSSIAIKDIVGIKKKIDISEILSILLKNMDSWFYSLKVQSFSYVKSYWLQNINQINSKIIVKNGSDSVSGIFSDIDEYGRLVLEKSEKRLFISSGDMFMNQEGIIVKHD